MSGFSAIDLARLPSPEVIESLDYNTIFDAMLADLTARDPSFTALVESDPAYKILEVAAYRELLLRSRINDATKSVMLAYATGANLEHLAALFGVARLVLDDGDEHTIPPTPKQYESDDRLRQRVQLSLEGHSTAGPVGSYVFHALNADAHVKDVSVMSPSPGTVQVTILSDDNQGIPTNELLDTVMQTLNADDIRPLTDQVMVQGATVITYTVDATLHLYSGPDANVVKAAAAMALDDYVLRHHLLDHDITLSGLYAALHQEGVQRVELHAPTADIVVENTEAAWCSDKTLVIGGVL